MKARLLALAISGLIAIPTFGQDPPKPPEKPAEKPAEKAEPAPQKFVRQHKIHIGSADFAYTTTAEDL